MPRLSKIGTAALAAFGWTGGASVSADFLVIAGGAGGGAGVSGGGGAGGFRTSAGASGGGASAEAKVSLNPTLSYAVTVGAGGAGGAGGSGNNGSAGTTSTISSFTSSLGVGGGSDGGAAGASGSGFAGGSTGGAPNYGGGGGGGDSAVGANGTTTAGGAGGAGTASSISGTSVTYAGGGGGGTYDGGTAGAGGSGGGGAGGSGANPATVGSPATSNTGSGGGGGGHYSVSGGGAAGGNGGSGVVIISYPAPQQFGGGVVTTSGANVIHTFNTSGTLSPLSALTASYLIVAGGGAGARRDAAMGGGGGAGGLLSGSGLTIDTNSNYVVTVGAGGATAADLLAGGSGTNSLFSGFVTTAIGGGGGGATNSAGLSGGSGGGGTHVAGGGGSGTVGQGNNGGALAGNIGGGGGGAGAVGTTSGGAGTASSISGSSVTYAGGGGGGGNGVTGGSGGSGGGGTGANGSSAGVAGTANLGGGGGGGGYNTLASAAGGSGVVIISYAGATQLMAGGTVTITGGNVIHTFTSSGYLTPIKLVNNSLRFRSSASAYLNRTPASATNRKTWTWSGWVKRGQLGSTDRLFSAGSGTTYTEILTVSDTIKINGQISGADNGQVSTVAVYRDPSAWYHLVLVFDVTAVTKIVVYINGVSQTLTTTTAFTNQNYEINNAISHNVGNFAPTPASAENWDGYLTEINFIDGQALTPTSFGTTNSYGVWQPITYGGSYGTNGFYLPFTNTTSATTLAYDFSPNGNNWTPNNISTTSGATYDSMTDVPTLTSATAANYVVLNPLSSGTSTYRLVLTNGNLTATSPIGNYQLRTNPTTFSSSGKFYCEVVFTAGYSAADGTLTTGFISASAGDRATNNNSLGYENTGAIGYLNNGSIYVNGSVHAASATYATYTINDVIMLAIDMDNQKVYVGKNGTWQNSGNPAAGTGFVYNSGILASGLWGFSASGYGSSPTPNTFVFNFGAGSGFTYTAPSGFVALNTYNL